MHNDELIGTIDRFVFQNQDTGFCVAIIQTKGVSAPITATGCLPGIHAGEQVHLHGSWIMHPKFGKQFEIKQFSTAAPTSSSGLKKYLASGLIKGIGPAYAERLVDHFGTHVLEIIDTMPQRLLEVSGIGQGRLNNIIASWQEQKEVSAIMVFLQGRGISSTYALKIYKQYGTQARVVLQEDPYRLAQDIWGIGFKTADQIAQTMGINPHAPQRVKAGILYILTTISTSGHLYSELQELKDKTSELLELSFEDDPKLKAALHDLHSNDKIKLITYEGKHYITLTQYYFSEKGVAQRIATQLKHPSKKNINDDIIQEQLSQASNGTIQLNADQRLGIKTCLNNKITIITGGPGTGKTTLIKQLLHILKEHQLQFKLAAPTGRAAKRITQGTGHQAMTLHRLLEYDFNTRGFAHNEKNALALDVLIVDEASMIDIFLAHALLKAIPFHAHLVLLGDIDQLPSVGAGNFLNDLIKSNKIPCVRLTEVFRQAQDSLIIVNAHRVNTGQFPVTQMPDSKRDFLFIKEDDQTKVMTHLTKIFSSELGRRSFSADDAIVLCPLNRGGAGTQKLNHDLQTLLNGDSTKPQLTHAGSVFKVGDQVMRIRNNYDKLVFNGDIGTIEAINTEDRTITVNCSERSIIYESNEFDEIVLAYAITIHKSQGSEYPVVIIPLFVTHFTMLARNLLYTAITRAKKLCIIIGQPKAIGIAVNNNKTIERTTFLQQFLTTDLSCR